MMTTRQSPVVCDINITPLIDVMLVLLITLIVSLPMTTHAVKLDMPNAPPARNVTPPEVIDLEIEFDGTLVWSGHTVKGFQELERDLRSAAGKSPQPEIRLYADRHVKYNFVALVLASAQRSGIQKMGFANTGEFAN
jgi:biopolymer transport protein ExbD